VTARKPSLGTCSGAAWQLLLASQKHTTASTLLLSYTEGLTPCQAGAHGITEPLISQGVVVYTGGGFVTVNAFTTERCSRVPGLCPPVCATRQFPPLPYVIMAIAAASLTI
jgi:hypothetical protein